MQNVIYAGLRNPGRDQAIYEALTCKSVAEVAEQFECSPSTVRAAGKRIEGLDTFTLTLEGGVKPCQSGRSQPNHSAARRFAPIGTTPAPSAI